MKNWTTTLLGLIVALIGPMAFGQSIDCKDSSERVRYNYWNQEGGPCCGRNSLLVQLDGQPLKSYSEIHGGPRSPGTVQDSNPKLMVTEGQRKNEVIVSRTRAELVTAFNMEIEFSRADGLPALPGYNSRSMVRVGMACTQVSALIPRPSPRH